MANSKEEVKHEWVGGLGRTVIGGLGVLLIGAGSLAIVEEPQKRNTDAFAGVAARLDGIQESIGELRNTVTRHGEDIAQLRAESARGDRFTSSDHAKFREFSDERHKGLDERLRRLEAAQGNITRYLTEEQRHQELLEAVTNGGAK